MCVAAVIFKPVSLEYLRLMHEDNPHGAGIACVKQGRLFFMKGLDADAIFGLQQVGAISFPYLLHFRWATLGDKIPELCHPFPIGPRALLGETVGFADSVLIHNGTWNRFEHHIPINSEIPAAVIDHASDTAIAAWLMQDNPDVIKEIMWATAVASVKNGELDVVTRGTWSQHEGNWYSNLNWVPTNKVNWGDWYQGSKWGRAVNTFDSTPKSLVGPTPSHSAYDNDADDDEEGTAAAVAAILGPDADASKDPYQLACDAWNKTPAYDSWEDYVRAKYGEEVANVLAEEAAGLGNSGAGLEDELADLDINLVSEEHDAVNAYLARQMIKEVA